MRTRRCISGTPQYTATSAFVPSSLSTSHLSMCPTRNCNSLDGITMWTIVSCTTFILFLTVLNVAPYGGQSVKPVVFKGARETKHRLTDKVTKGVGNCKNDNPPAYSLMPNSRDYFLRSFLLVSDTKFPLVSRLNERFFAAL
jgi:hypothetical protein